MLYIYWKNKLNIYLSIYIISWFLANKKCVSIFPIRIHSVIPLLPSLLLYIDINVFNTWKYFILELYCEWNWQYWCLVLIFFPSWVSYIKRWFFIVLCTFLICEKDFVDWNYGKTRDTTVYIITYKAAYKFEWWNKNNKETSSSLRTTTLYPWLDSNNLVNKQTIMYMKELELYFRKVWYWHG